MGTSYLTFIGDLRKIICEYFGEKLCYKEFQ